MTEDIYRFETVQKESKNGPHVPESHDLHGFTFGLGCCTGKLSYFRSFGAPGYGRTVSSSVGERHGLRHSKSPSGSCPRLENLFEIPRRTMLPTGEDLRHGAALPGLVFIVNPEAGAGKTKRDWIKFSKIVKRLVTVID